MDIDSNNLRQIVADMETIERAYCAAQEAYRRAPFGEKGRALKKLHRRAADALRADALHDFLKRFTR